MTKSTEIGRLASKDREALVALISLAFGGPEVARLGKLIDASTLPGFGAFCEGELVGELTYLVEDKECELVTLNVKDRRMGTGSILMKAFDEFVKGKKFSRVFLVTTNDNLDALCFYQQRGWQIEEVHPRAVDVARKELKPQIPLTGAYGIPIRDEITLTLSLTT